MVGLVLGRSGSPSPIVRKARKLLGIGLDTLIWSADRIFDYRFGTDTSGPTKLWELRIASPHAEHGRHYEPSPANLFKLAMRHIPVDHREYVFVDLGSGKGRALLLASHFPFAEIVGVEFSEELHNVATANLAKYRARGQVCRNMASVCADATEFSMPNANLVVYLCNPFDDVVLSKVMPKIEGVAHRHKVYLVYCQAVHSEITDAASALPYRQSIQLPRFILRRPGAYSSMVIYSNQDFTAHD